MRASYGIAFLVFCMFPLMSTFAQSICTDARYEPGGFALSSTDICHDEAVTITNTAGVENPKYYYNYRGESYEEVMALGTATLDFSTVAKPGLYQVIQVGMKNGKETVFCQEIKVRNSTTPVFSYTFCTSPTRIEVIIPSHPLNDYTGYQIDLNGTFHNVTTTNFTYSFPVANIPNSLKITGTGGTKTCSSAPLTTVVPPYNAAGRDFDYYPEIKELKVLDDKSVQISIQGQYQEAYNLFRYEAGQPNVGLSPVKTGLKSEVPVTDTPADPARVYCYFIQPAATANCGLFSLRSADICSVPLTSPLPPTPAINYLQWRTYTAPPVSHRLSELLKISNGEAEPSLQVNNSFAYQDNHGDCSKRICYRIKVTYAGNNGGVNFSGISLSNQLCFDHRQELTDYPQNAFVSTEDQSNLVQFDAPVSSPYAPDRWELFKYDGSAYTLLETLPAGPASPRIADPAPVSKSEKYKLRYVDECENTSAFSPDLSSIYLTGDDNNVLHWTGDTPFADAGIRGYEVIYYEGENPNNIMGSQPVSASQLSHLISSSSFTNMGTFRVKAISSDDRESFSNLLTFAVRGSLFLPTAFSPNADNTNDTFKAKGSLGGIKTFHMEIFSSTGQKIADITDPFQGWDGRLPNGDKALFGNYLYTLKADMTNGQTINKNGSFVLLY